MTVKSVLIRPQGLRPGARASTCTPFATPLDYVITAAADAMDSIVDNFPVRDRKLSTQSYASLSKRTAVVSTREMIERHVNKVKVNSIQASLY